MEDGELVLINYVGRLKDNGQVFEVTSEELAKKENIYNPSFKYGPVPVIIGGGFILKALDEAIKKMKVGEKKEVELPPAEAFGERDENLIKNIPINMFKDQEPIVGSYAKFNGFVGKILSINGGRVKIDFNHPLAGKIIIYEIEIVSKVEDPVEKIKYIVNYFTGVDNNNLEIKVIDGLVDVEFKNHEEIPTKIKEMIKENVFKWIKGSERLRFLDTYNK